MANNGNLTTPQRRSIAALLTERNVQAAARVAHVGERTLYRWVTESAPFQAELKAAEARAIDAAIRRLAELTGAAVDTLREVMVDTEVSAGARVQAANVALSRLLELKELADLEGRLTAVEAVLKAGVAHESKNAN